MQATIIMPIVAVLALLAKGVFGIEIGEELQAQIADAILNMALAVIAVVGIVKGQRKNKTPNQAKVKTT